MVDPLVFTGIFSLAWEGWDRLMSEATPTKPNIDAWQAHQLRCTFFATPDALPLESRGWWESAIESPPERIEDQPKIGRHIEEGPFLDGLLTLSAQANRIDWLLGPVIDPDQGFHGLWPIGPFPLVRDEYLAKVLRWVPSAPPCHRIAFGGRLLLPVSSREEGYRLLAAYLPFAPDPEGSSDLRYQINRPRWSQVRPDLKINRSQAWSVSLSWLSVIRRADNREITRQERSSICLDPDVNTAAEFLNRLPADQIADLMKELADLTAGLVVEGDRP
jgi:hypothetical protein